MSFQRCPQKFWLCVSNSSLHCLASQSTLSKQGRTALRYHLRIWSHKSALAFDPVETFFLGANDDCSCCVLAHGARGSWHPCICGKGNFQCRTHPPLVVHTVLIPIHLADIKILKSSKKTLPHACRVGDLPRINLGAGVFVGSPEKR